MYPPFVARQIATTLLMIGLSLLGVVAYMLLPIAGVADGYELTAKIPTRANAQTSIWIPQLNRYYVSASANDNEDAAILVFEPQL
jgi:hypothetical protein